MLKKQELLQTIVGRLAYLKSVVSSLNSIHFFDLNVVAEDFFASLLNEVYGYNLVNLNHKKLNNAAIDLGDPDQRVAVQVTSQRRKTKIQNTLDCFAEHGLEREYDTVKILIIGDRTGDYPTLVVPPSIQFVGKIDVIDMNQLLKDINKLDVPRLIRIARLVEQEIDLSTMGESRSSGTKPFQAPPLPPHFIKRREAEDHVKQMLFAKTASSGILVAGAVHGLGGLGKSVLAASVAHMDEVQQRFPDGILWTTLGQEPNVVERLAEWIRALGDNEFRVTSDAIASAHLRTLLRAKRVLLIIDDVWKVEHINFFLVAGYPSAVLITTRHADIAETVGATLFQLELMDPHESLQLLAARLGDNRVRSDRAQALMLAKELGYLPMALSLSAAQLRSGLSWGELLSDLRGEVVRLERLKSAGRLEEYGTSSLHLKDYSLLASFNLSLKQLDRLILERFSWFGVLAEDAVFDARIMSTVWNAPTPDAAATLRYMADKSLIYAVAKRNGKSTFYRVHDLLHDYARHLLAAPTPYLEELEGLGLSRVDAHRKLLDQYLNKTEDGLWHTLAPDGYIQSHLIWHLEKADRLEEIHKLLGQETQERRNAWHQTREQEGEIEGYFSDVARATELAEKEGPEAIALSFRCSAIMASMHSRASNVPKQVITAFVDKGVWSPAQAFAYLKKITNSLERLKSLWALIQILPASAKEDALRQALSTARELTKEEEPRPIWLAAVASRLPEDEQAAVFCEALAAASRQYGDVFGDVASWIPDHLASKIIEAIAAIERGYQRFTALKSVAGRLPEAVHCDALRLAKSLPARERIQFLTMLAPQLTNPAKDQVIRQLLEEGEAGIGENELMNLIQNLASELSARLLPKGIQLARKIKNPEYRSAALVAMIPYLDGHEKSETMKQSLDAASAADADVSRGHALAATLPILDEPLLARASRQVLQVVSSIQNGDEKLRILRRTFTKIDDQFRVEAEQQVLDAVQAIAVLSHYDLANLHGLNDYELGKREKQQAIRNLENRFKSIQLLAEFAPRLSPSTKEAALKGALAIIKQPMSEKNRALALKALAPVLPESLLPTALIITFQMKESRFVGRSVEAIAPHLSQSLLDEAFTIALACQDKATRALALAALLPHLSDPLRQSATARGLDAALAEGKKHARSEALAVLAPFLSVAQLQRVSETFQIGDDYQRITALSALIPHLASTDHSLVTKAANTFLERWQRVDFLNNSLPHLSRKDRVQAATLAIKDAWDLEDYETNRTKCLMRLFPYLGEADRCDVLWRVWAPFTTSSSNDHKADFNELLPVLPTFLEHNPVAFQTLAVQVAAKLSDPNNRIKVLSSIIPSLNRAVRNEAIEQLFAEPFHCGIDTMLFVIEQLKPCMTETIRFHAVRCFWPQCWYQKNAKTVAAIVPLVPEAMLRDYASYVVNEVHHRPEANAELVAHLAPFLPDPYTGPIIKKVAESLLVTNIRTYSVVRALTKLGENTREPLRGRLLSRALELVIEGTFASLSDIASVVRILPAPLLERTLDAATELPATGAKIQVLASILPHLSSFKKEKAASLILDRLRLFTQYRNYYRREETRAIEAVATHFPEFPIPLRYSAWCQLLRICSDDNREQFFRYLPLFVPGLVEFGGTKGVKAAFNAIQDSVKWWP